MVPLVNTRAPEDAERLRWAGPVVSAPVVAFEPLEVEAARVPVRRILAVTTPRSVPAAAACAAGRELWALAPRTSAALVALGLPVARAVSGGVADLLDGAPLADVCLFTSDLGVTEAAARWPGLAAVATHRTVRPPTLPAPAWALLHGPDPYDVLVASPSAVHNLEALAPGALGRARRVLCHGRSTLRAAVAFHGGAEPCDLGV